MATSCDLYAPRCTTTVPQTAKFYVCSDVYNRLHLHSYIVVPMFLLILTNIFIYPTWTVNCTSFISTSPIYCCFNDLNLNVFVLKVRCKLPMIKCPHDPICNGTKKSHEFNAPESMINAVLLLSHVKPNFQRSNSICALVKSIC